MADRDVGTEPRAGECPFVGGTVAGDGGTDHAARLVGGMPEAAMQWLSQRARSRRRCPGRSSRTARRPWPGRACRRRRCATRCALRQEALVASALPDVGEHDDAWAGPDVAGGQAPLQRAETAAEGDLHRLGKMLAGKTRTANACHARSRAANVLSSSAASRTPRTVAPGVASAGVLSSVKPPPSRGAPPAPFRYRRRSRSPGGHRPA